MGGVPGGGRVAWDPPPLGAMFGALREQDVRSLAGPVIGVIVPPDTELVSEGEQIGTFFLIRSGTATLSCDGVAVASLGSNDCFGEADPDAPTAQRFTITAATKLHLLSFSSLGIERLCNEIPGARERIRESLAVVASAGSAGALPERGGVQNGDRTVVGGDPAELAHQAQCSGDRLTRGSRPARKLILRQR
jgi:Cyclic nucleotide-binding domain